MEGMRIKSVALEDARGCKADSTGRTIEFYGSVFGVRDTYGDVVERGAFAKSIRERWPRKLIKVFRNHYDPVGMPEELREDEFGLFCRAKIDNTAAGDETLEQVASGTLAHASFMYRILQWRREQDGEGGEETLFLTELKLFELGPVNFPAMELAAILAVQKSGRPSHAALIDFALTDLLAPAKAGLEALARRDHLTDYERREISAALKDLAPFVDRLREIEVAAGGPDPLMGTTRTDKQGPEPASATTPDSAATVLLAEKIAEALQATRRLRDRWAA
jgi:HK97 family phage prohead protease